MITPTLLIDGTVKLDLDSRILTVRSWPTAHSDNDVSVLDEQTRTLFAGDLVFLTHTPVLDGSLRGWLKVIDELSTLPAQRVVPGHGAASEWPGRCPTNAATSKYWPRMFASSSPVANR